MPAFLSLTGGYSSRPRVRVSKGRPAAPYPDPARVVGCDMTNQDFYYEDESADLAAEMDADRRAEDECEMGPADDD